MTQAHELPDDSRLDEMADKLGNYTLARAALGLPPEPDEDHPVASTVPRAKKPRYSRRGGRSYPEPSDSELDPHWQSTGERLKPEEAQRKIRGVAAARQAIADTAKAREAALQPPPHDPEAMKRAARESWNKPKE